MKQFVFSTLFIALFFSTSAQTDNTIVIGKIDSLHSTILNEERKVWVHVPGGDGNIYAEKKYPVVYLLDGDGHFSSVVGMIQQLSTVNGNMICPEMIVVGIPNTDRTRDLTPTHVDADPPYMDSAFSRTSGGGEKFISFIEIELKPYINSNYPTEPYSRKRKLPEKYALIMLFCERQQAMCQEAVKPERSTGRNAYRRISLQQAG